jgi:hypothetical protein
MLSEMECCRQSDGHTTLWVQAVVPIRFLCIAEILLTNENATRISGISTSDERIETVVAASSELGLSTRMAIRKDICPRNPEISQRVHHQPNRAEPICVVHWAGLWLTWGA